MKPWKELKVGRIMFVDIFLLNYVLVTRVIPSISVGQG